MRIIAKFITLAAAMLLFIGTASQAAQFELVGDYTIHYNAVNTTILPPKMAKTYNLTRSKNRALLNIAVRKKGSEESPLDSAVPALVKVTAVNLSMQFREIEMREIREPGAIYYIGVFTISNEEILDFTLEVTPESQGEPHIFKFQQQFFVD